MSELNATHEEMAEEETGDLMAEEIYKFVLATQYGVQRTPLCV